MAANSQLNRAIFGYEAYGITEQDAVPPAPESVRKHGADDPLSFVVQLIDPPGLSLPSTCVTVATQVMLDPYVTTGLPLLQLKIVVLP
jgi:hypothetical protein